MAYVILIAIALMGLICLAGDRRHFVGFILLTAGFPFTLLMPNSVLFGFAGGMSPEAAFLFLTVLILILVCLTEQQATARTFAALAPFVVFLGYTLISITWTSNTVYGLRFLIKLVTPLLFAVLVLSALRSPHDVIRAEKLIVLGCLLILLIAVLNTLSGGALDGAVGRAKWAGSGVLVAPYKSPANFSFLLSINAVLCLANYLTSRKQAWLLLYVLFSVAVFASFTRISMAALLLCSYIVVFQLSRSTLLRYVVPPALAFISVLAVFVYKPLRDRMFFSGTQVDFGNMDLHSLLDSVNTSGRTSLWQAALDFFATRDEFLGAGSGSVDFWLSNHSQASALHSEYLRLYIEFGVLGLTLFLLAMLLMYLRVLRRPERLKYTAPTQLERKYRALTSAIMTLFVMTMLTDNTLNYIADMGYQLFYCFGVLMAVQTGNWATQRRLEMGAHNRQDTERNPRFNLI